MSLEDAAAVLATNERQFLTSLAAPRASGFFWHWEDPICADEGA
jgi:hypothetical protein